ncbi:MAG: hypothetical protein A2Y97_05685 [Nitrospirae bacterium RBG_13_39_12]|nr:MAG: hypothetical protein A2Y97_05685 [Nitrospirae bacterium RBG_13_39_12]
MSLLEIDTTVFLFINTELQNNFFDIIMPFITERAYLIFLPIFLWFFFKDRKNALIALVIAFASTLISDWSSNALKHYFERVRPCNELDGVRALVGCARSFSMPSNHAVNAFAFITPFFILLKNRVRYALIIVAFLVGFSRVYVGVHYPSDVIVGALFGIVSAISIIGFYKWSLKRFETKPYVTLLFVFLLAINLFNIYYIQNGPLDLSPDEAHYWEWSRRLDLSYYSKGPMIAYLIHLGTYIFGDTVFGIRIMAVMFFILSSMLLYKLGKNLYDEQVGFFSAVLLQIIPLFSAYSILFTIDSLIIFFWSLSLYLFSKASNVKSLNQHTSIAKDNSSAVSNQDPLIKLKQRSNMSLAFWSLLGISIGLGLLAKYTMALFYICAFLFLFFSKDHRRLLFTKGPAVAFIISLLVLSPVIIWNTNHEWVTLKHTAGQVHIADGFQISFKSFFEFLGSQFGVITPLLLIFMAVSVWKIRKRCEGSFLFWFSIPIIAIFLIKSLHAKVQANWALSGYLTCIIAFSAIYMKNLYSAKIGFKILVSTAVFLSLIVTIVAHYPSLLNLPIENDPTSKLRGWKELGAEVSKIYEQTSTTRPVFIFSDRYQVSSELAFYIKGHPVTYCVNLGRRMNQYDFWPGFYNLLHYDAIFVRTGYGKIPYKVAKAFKKVEKRSLKVYTKNQIKIRDYSIFLCYDFKGLKKTTPDSF